MTRIKKFFAPILRTYNNNIEKRWRVEYWEPVEAGKPKRVSIYGHINTGASIEERTRIAYQLINSLPFKSTKEESILDIAINNAEIELRPKTIKSYKVVAEKFHVFLGSNDALTATEKTVNDFLLRMHKEGIKQNTISKYRSFLHVLYNKAIDLKLTEFNPVKKVKHIKRRPQSLYFFTDEQIGKIKAAEMPSQLWLAIQLLFYCFIRPTEMRGLKIGHINFEYGFIEVPGEISKNKKTEKVSIPDPFFKQLLFLKQYPNSFFILGKGGVPGQKQIAQNWLNNQHSKVLGVLKIRGRYAFYSWKHTGAVKAVKAGINIKDLQMQLRHHSLDMVNEYLKNLGVMDSEDLKNKYPTL